MIFINTNKGDVMVPFCELPTMGDVYRYELSYPWLCC